MNREINFSKLLCCGTIASTLLYAGCLLGIILWIPGWFNRLLLILGLSMILLICLWVNLKMRKNIVAYTDTIAKNIDDLVDHKALALTAATAETLEGKVQVKLQRLYQIMEEQASKNLREKESIQSLISDISHQIKTPIANVKMYTDILMERDVTKEKQEEFLCAIASQVQKLDFLIQAMIKMSRLETGVIQVVPKHLPIGSTVQDAFNEVQAKAAARQICIQKEFENEIMAFHDPKWTAEAIGNLLDNAIKYSPIGSTIRITAQRQEFYTRIFISDEGKGIAENRQAEIFKRFYREPEVQEKEGIGIGLFLAREIISLQQGMIEVRSRLEKGSHFIISLSNESIQ